MRTYIKSKFLIQSVLVFMGVPLLMWALGSVQLRSFPKEAFSILSILTFCLVMGLPYWSRANRRAARDLKMSRVISLHKAIGYTCVTAILFHPVFLVVPRCFEAGVDPVDALATILTTFNHGIVLGMIAWCLILTIGITSLVRKKLPMAYTTWRTFHGILGILFIAVSAWHVIDLGRHSSLGMSAFIILVAAIGIILTGKPYILKIGKKNGDSS